MTAPLYPDVAIEATDTHMEQNTTLFTVKTRIPNEKLEDPDFLSKMFMELANGS